MKGHIIMKLNPDCVRDILLTVEETSSFNRYTCYSVDDMNFDRLRKYSHEEIIYHIKQCNESHLISGVQSYDCGDEINIQDLTPSGHQFLANIRSETNWQKTKEIANKSGSVALNILETISRGIAEGAASALLDQK